MSEPTLSQVSPPSPHATTPFPTSPSAPLPFRLSTPPRGPRRSPLPPAPYPAPAAQERPLPRPLPPSAAPPSHPQSPPPASWSPGVVRKLRWRLRRYTLWDTLVFSAFVLSTLVFFSAISGVGRAPPQPAPAPVHLVRVAGWRSPAAVLAPQQARPADVLGSFLRFSGLAWRSEVRGPAEGDAADAAAGGVPPRAGRRVHGRFGAWRERRHATVPGRGAHDVSPPDESRGRVRVPWGERGGRSPEHDPFHERFARLMASSGSQDAAVDSAGDASGDLDEDAGGKMVPDAATGVESNSRP